MQRLCKLFHLMPARVCRFNLANRTGLLSLTQRGASFQFINGERPQRAQYATAFTILKKHLPRQYHSPIFYKMLESAAKSPNFTQIANEIVQNQQQQWKAGFTSQRDLEQFTTSSLLTLKALVNIPLEARIQDAVSTLFSRFLTCREKHPDLFVEMEEKTLFKIFRFMKSIEKEMKIKQISYNKSALDQLVVSQSRKRVRTGVHQFYGKFLEYLMKEDQLQSEDLEYLDQYIKIIENQSNAGNYNFTELNTLQLLNRYVIRRKSQGRWKEEQQQYFVEINLDIKKLCDSIKEMQGRPLMFSQRVWTLLQLLDSQSQDNLSIQSRLIVFVFNYMNASKEVNQDLFFSDQNQSELTNMSFNAVYFDILPVIMANIDTFNIRDLQVILEGLIKTFSRLNKTAPELEIILERLTKHLKEHKVIPAALIMSLASSMKLLRYDHQEMFSLIIQRIKASQRLLNDMELLVYCAKLFAGMGQNQKFNTMLNIIKSTNYKKYLRSPKLWVELLYFMNETEILDAELLDWSLDFLTSRVNSETHRIPQLPVVYHRQLILACLSLEMTHPKIYEKYSLQKFRFFETTDRDFEVLQISNPHKRFMLRLTELGYEIEPEKEIKLDSIILRKDLYLPQLNLFVEIDGPAHYKLNQPTQKLIPEKLEEKILKQKGYQYFRIGHEFQDELFQCTTEEARTKLVDQYLTQNQFPEVKERLAQFKDA